MSLSLEDGKVTFSTFPVKLDFDQAKDISEKVLDGNSKPPFSYFSKKIDEIFPKQINVLCLKGERGDFVQLCSQRNAFNNSRT